MSPPQSGRFRFINASGGWYYDLGLEPQVIYSFIVVYLVCPYQASTPTQETGIFFASNRSQLFSRGWNQSQGWDFEKSFLYGNFFGAPWSVIYIPKIGNLNGHSFYKPPCLLSMHFLGHIIFLPIPNNWFLPLEKVRERHDGWKNYDSAQHLPKQ